jgi:hypothetical protein
LERNRQKPEAAVCRHFAKKLRCATAISFRSGSPDRAKRTTILRTDALEGVFLETRSALGFSKNSAYRRAASRNVAVSLGHLELRQTSRVQVPIPS